MTGADLFACPGCEQLVARARGPDGPVVLDSDPFVVRQLYRVVGAAEGLEVVRAFGDSDPQPTLVTLHRCRKEAAHA